MTAQNQQGPGSPNPAPNPGPRAGHQFFQWLRQLGLRRGSNRWIGGVCSGVARRLGWDPLLVRIIWFALCFFGGAGIALYGIAWLLLPDERDGSILLEAVTQGHVTAGFVISILMILGGVTGSTASIPFLGVGLIVTIALVIAAVAVLSSQGPNTWNDNWHYDESTKQYVQNQQPFTDANPGSEQTGETGAPAASAPPVWNGGQPSANATTGPAPTQPWDTSTATMPLNAPAAAAASPRYYTIRKPANQASIAIIYGLLFLTGAVAAGLAALLPQDAGITGAQWFMIWVLAADAIVGISLIALGIAGRRSSAIGWMVVPLLILSIFVVPQYGTVQSRSAHLTQNATTVVMSQRTYTADDMPGISKGVGVYMSSATIDLSDWSTSATARKATNKKAKECPTGNLVIHSAFSSVDITLPEGCTWTTTSSDLAVVGSTVDGYRAQSPSKTNDPLRISGILSFSSLSVEQE